MDITTIIITVIIVLIVFAKIYNGYNTVNKKGIKGLITQKLAMFSFVTVIFGVVMFINPNFQIENPKDTITGWISSITQ